MTDLISQATLAIGYAEEDGDIIKTVQTADESRTSARRRRDESEDLAAAWAKSYLLGEPIRHPRGTSGNVRYAELFCGSGGLGLGFGEAARELGLSPISMACLDHDAEAVEVYAANHGSRVRTSRSASEIVDYQVMGSGDEAEFLYEPELVDRDWQEIVGRVDVLLAGPPCQGHSNLNNRTRRIDKRNQLYLTVPATAIALRADVVIIENVEAVVHDRSRVVDSSRTLLESAGYVVESGVISAVAIGWPQTRKRYFMIARKSSSPIPLATLMPSLATPGRDLMWAIDDLVDRELDGRLHITVDLSAENRRRIDFLFDNEQFDLPPSERPDCHKEGTTYGAVYGRLYPDRPAPTITTGFLTPGRGRYIHPYLRRTLTPLEAARIQGYPDSYDFFPNPKSLPSKSKLTKWIGDAVPMPLGYAASLAALGSRPTFGPPT